MTDLEHRLAEDKALRDAALSLFSADLALIRADLKERGIGARVADRLGEGTMELVDDAADYAQANRGKVAAMIAAIVLWFARKPIIDGLNGLFADEGEDETAPEPPAPPGRSRIRKTGVSK